MGCICKVVGLLSFHCIPAETILHSLSQTGHVLYFSNSQTLDKKAQLLIHTLMTENGSNDMQAIIFLLSAPPIDTNNPWPA